TTEDRSSGIACRLRADCATRRDRVVLGLCGIADFIPARDDVSARACSVVQVGVTVEGRHGSSSSSCVTCIAETTGAQAHSAGRIKPRLGGLPCSDASNRIEHLCRWLRGFIVTNHGNAAGVAVKATYVSTHDTTLQTAIAAFVDGVVLVNQHVVAHIAPAKSLRVVLEDSTNLSGSLSWGVVVVTSSMVQG